MTIGLIDLDTGNLASLKSAMIKLNIKFKVCKKKFDFEKIDKIIMPGVGAFKDLYKRVIDTGIDKIFIGKSRKKTINFRNMCWFSGIFQAVLSMVILRD